MNREKILEEIGKIDRIPTMLSIAMEIERLVRDPNSTTPQLAAVIKLDPSLTTRVLKVANSAAFASTREIIDIKMVINRIGFEGIRKIALSVAVLNSFSLTHIDYEKFWLHSITTAYLSDQLSILAKPNDPNRPLFSCGILHDIGVLIFDQYFPDLYKKIFQLSAKEKVDLHLLESEYLGISHAELGAIVLEKWNIPSFITEVVHHHHFPERATAETDNARLIYLANFICNNRGLDNGTGFFPSGFDDDIFEKLHLKVDDMPAIIERVEKETQTAKEILRLGGR